MQVSDTAAGEVARATDTEFEPQLGALVRAGMLYIAVGDHCGSQCAAVLCAVCLLVGSMDLQRRVVTLQIVQADHAFKGGIIYAQMHTSGDMAGKCRYSISWGVMFACTADL
jgi:hypothetical protein